MGGFSENLKEICNDYYYNRLETPPCPLSMARMNGLLDGSKKPKIDELLILSEAFDVIINQLLTGDKLFPSLHELDEEDAERILAEIEELRENTGG